MKRLKEMDAALPSALKAKLEDESIQTPNTCLKFGRESIDFVLLQAVPLFAPYLERSKKTGAAAAFQVSAACAVPAVLCPRPKRANWWLFAWFPYLF